MVRFWRSRHEPRAVNVKMDASIEKVSVVQAELSVLRAGGDTAKACIGDGSVSSKKRKTIKQIDRVCILDVKHFGIASTILKAVVNVEALEKCAMNLF